MLDFITCVVDEDYSIVGGYDFFLSLLAKFQEVLEDTTTTRYYEIKLRMSELKLRSIIITMLLNSIGMIYSKVLIDSLRSVDEEFEQFTFEADTIDNDLQLIKNIEINNDIEYGDLKKELEVMESGGNGGIRMESKKSDENFYHNVSSYNEIFKTSFSITNLTVMEYAIMMKRKNKHIEEVNAKNNGA